eukprot:scaffold1208_cov231-Pinguiococcus_pyrenoidosus.AAC.1
MIRCRCRIIRGAATMFPATPPIRSKPTTTGVQEPWLPSLDAFSGASGASGICCRDSSVEFSGTFRSKAGFPGPSPAECRSSTETLGKKEAEGGELRARAVDQCCGVGGNLKRNTVLEA